LPRRGPGAVGQNDQVVRCRIAVTRARDERLHLFWWRSVMRRSSRRIGVSTPGILVISVVVDPVSSSCRLQVGNVSAGCMRLSTAIRIVIDYPGPLLERTFGMPMIEVGRPEV